MKTLEDKIAADLENLKSFSRADLIRYIAGLVQRTSREVAEDADRDNAAVVKMLKKFYESNRRQEIEDEHRRCVELLREYGENFMTRAAEFLQANPPFPTEPEKPRERCGTCAHLSARSSVPVCRIGFMTAGVPEIKAVNPDDPCHHRPGEWKEKV